MYRIIIFPVVLYGCNIWSLTLKEGHRLLVSENRVLRKEDIWAYAGRGNREVEESLQ